MSKRTNLLLVAGVTAWAACSGAAQRPQRAAMLLPDDFRGEIRAGWKQVNDNLAVRE